MKATTPATREFPITPASEEAALAAAESRGEAPPPVTRFHCRPLTQAERLRTYDDENVVQVNPDGSRILVRRSFWMAREILLASLVRVENFPDDAPREYPATGTRAEKEAYLATIDDLVLHEIGQAARDRAALGETAGN